MDLFWKNPRLLPLTSLLLVLLINVPSPVSSVLGADPASLMRIVQRLCGERHDEAFASQFYGCYSELMENEKCIFDTCQKETFGCTLSTVKNIEHTCKSASQLPKYTDCLMAKFASCSLDIVKAVTQINVCQGHLLGLE